MSTERFLSAVVVHGVVKDELFARLKSDGCQQVVILEGRPSLDSAKINGKAVLRNKMKPVLVADNMPGFLFFQKMVKEVWIAYSVKGEDGILSEIGGLVLGVLARKHGVPVYAFPAARTTPYLGYKKDIVKFNGTRVVPDKTRVYVPLVEWVPASYLRKVYDI